MLHEWLLWSNRHSSVDDVYWSFAAGQLSNPEPTSRLRLNKSYGRHTAMRNLIYDVTCGIAIGVVFAAAIFWRHFENMVGEEHANAYFILIEFALLCLIGVTKKFAKGSVSGRDKSVKQHQPE